MNFRVLEAEAPKLRYAGERMMLLQAVPRLTRRLRVLADKLTVVSLSWEAGQNDFVVLDRSDASRVKAGEAALHTCCAFLPRREGA